MNDQYNATGIDDSKHAMQVIIAIAKAGGKKEKKGSGLIFLLNVGLS